MRRAQIVIGAILAGAWLALGASSLASGPASAQPAAAQAVPVGTVSAALQPTTPCADFVGRVEAVDRVEVRARVTDETPAEATKAAMAQITAPIMAVTLVLLSVFVPIGFISGISGELFRQFAVTVGFAMFLSAINALTLSPALCALRLKPHHGPRRGPIGYVMRFIDRVRDGYVRSSRASCVSR